MTLDDFDRAVVLADRLCELARGIIEFRDAPDRSHTAQTREVMSQIRRYEAKHPNVIEFAGSAGETKVLVEPDQSGRLPDISIYLGPPLDPRNVWSTWTPEIVVEVVSRDSAQRDYHDVPVEYLRLGALRYWIIDAFKGRMIVLTRWRGIWKKQIVKPSTKYTTELLPGFSLNLKRIFAAAKRA